MFLAYSILELSTANQKSTTSRNRQKRVSFAAFDGHKVAQASKINKKLTKLIAYCLLMLLDVIQEASG